MTPINSVLLRTAQLTAIAIIVSFVWLAPQSLAHGNANAPSSCFLRAAAIMTCFGEAINLSQGSTVATPGTPFTVPWGTTLTLNVDPTSSYTFFGSIGIVLESVSIGSGGGVTLLVLCNDPGTGLNVSSSVPACSPFVSNGGKSMNIPLSGPGVTGTYRLGTINGTSPRDSMHADGRSAVKFVPAGTSSGGGSGGSGGGTNPPRRKVGTPIINSVNVSPNHKVPAGGSVRGVISFSDSDADVDRLELRTLSNTAIGSQSLNPRVRGFSSGSIPFDIFHHFYCKNAMSFSINVVLIDQAGHESNPVRVDFTCDNPTTSTAPVINHIDMPRNIPLGGSVNGELTFADPDGDVVRVEFRPISNASGSSWNPNVSGQKTGKVSINQACNVPGPISQNLVLTDSAGNESNVFQLDFVCAAKKTGGSTPVIVDISPKNPKIRTNGDVRYTINFSDQQGDIVRAEGRDPKTGTMFMWWDPGIYGMKNGFFYELQSCGTYVGKFRYNLVLIDQQGNESSPMPIEVECGNGPGFLSIQSVQGPMPNVHLGGHIPALVARVDSNANTLSVQAVQLNAVSTGSFELRIQGQGIASVQMQVFNLSGDVMFNETSSDNTLRWQGLDNRGHTLANGVYFYVVTITGVNGEVQRSQVKKLVVLN